MLTKDDLNQINEIVQKNIKFSFVEFYDSLFEPFASRIEEKLDGNDKQHEEIVKEIKTIQNEIKTIQNDTDEIKDYIKDHDKRINDLESTTLAKN